MGDISQQLLDQVQAAMADNKPLTIMGNGSKSFMGRETPKAQALLVAEHSGIVSYQPEELVITARAGTSVREVQSALAEHDQALFFEPPQTFYDQYAGVESEATIGGTLACNLSGAARPWAGSVRDAVLGTRIINGKAEYLRFGGQVIKNVAGYDVSRMQAGAMGTLGVITEISFKVLPKMNVTTTLKGELGADEAIHLMNQLAGTPKPLNGACWFDNNVFLRLSGAKSVVASTVKSWVNTYGLREIESLGSANPLWSNLTEHKLSCFSRSHESDSELWRFSVKPNAEAILPEASWIIDWCGAQRWLTSNRGEYRLDELEQYAARLGGQVSLYRGGDRSGDVFHRQSEVLKTISLCVKKAFDPQGLFNTGRLYPWM